MKVLGKKCVRIIKQTAKYAAESVDDFEKLTPIEVRKVKPFTKKER